MPKPFSAIDSIGPAFTQTKKQLFAPFRFKRWLRLAIVCMLTGEFAGGGGGGGGNFNFPIPHDKGRKGLMALPHADWSKILPWLPWIVGGIVLLFLLLFVFMYVSSVYRFVLLDSVLNDHCEFKGSWKRWEPGGRSYFFWGLSIFLISSLTFCLILGVPLLIAWQIGLFHHPGEHVLALILGGVGTFFALIAFAVVGAIVGLFAKDFCVPIMAMESVGVLAAWRKLLPTIGAEKMAFTGYVLMKIVLAIGSAIIVGMATFIILIVLLIPLGIAGVAIFFAGKAMGVTMSVATICVLVVAGGILFIVFFYLLALLSTPSMVFFQSYTLHFIGSRYPAVGNVLFPPPPEIAPPLPLPELPPPSGAGLTPPSLEAFPPGDRNSQSLDYFFARLPGFTAGIPAWQSGHSSGL